MLEIAIPHVDAWNVWFNATGTRPAGIPPLRDAVAAACLAVGRAPGSVDDFLNAFVPMIPAVNEFFDKVLVMAEDKALQENRLGLLQRIAALADGIADLSKLEGF